MAGTTYDYVLVGGGMAADAAARGIRELDASGSIGILSADADPPYTRPALSKKLWTDPDFGEDRVPLGTAEATGAEVLLGAVVTGIDRSAQAVRTAAGDIGYGKLLLVPGASARSLDGPEHHRSIAFRSRADYRLLRELSGHGRHAVVVGGGYIGSELAAALVQNDTRVTLVFPDERLGASMYPPELVELVERRFVEHGVELRPGRRAVDSEPTPVGVRVRLDDGSVIDADAVVVGLGATPVVDLAESAGLAVDDGIVVDDHLRTADSAIWAAGDAASYPDPILGRTRVEHVDHAEQSGRAAGRSMAGDETPYTHTPSFYSDQFDLGWEAVGRLDPALDTVVDWVEPGESAVAYYLDGDRPVGVLLWNVWDATDAAREVLAGGATSADSLRGRIP